MSSGVSDLSAVDAPGLYVPTTCMTAVVGGSNLLRQLVRSFLEGNGYPVSLCIEQVDSAEQGLHEALGNTGVVVLLLGHAPGPALQSIRRAMKWSGALPLVVVSEEIHPGTIHAALRNGTKGFLCTQADPAELTRAVQMARCGKVHLDPEVAQLLIDEVTPGAKRKAAPDLPLSRREIGRAHV
jgi:DNA-binding NarL/FixJ family response regulator